jgi:hypothetical protein
MSAPAEAGEPLVLPVTDSAPHSPAPIAVADR